MKKRVKEVLLGSVSLIGFGSLMLGAIGLMHGAVDGVPVWLTILGALMLIGGVTGDAISKESNA